MNTYPLISIIVPIYKVEQYLGRCVESIVNQTYKNLEIILVDDGSPDNCPAMCDNWACKDARIKVVHKQNGGLSDARNAGMDIAKGEYIAFVDSDDYVRSDMYELLYNNMQENESDISACGVEMVREDETPIAMLTPLGSYVLNNEEAMIAIIEEDVLKQPVWYKLYKLKCVQNNYFPVGKYHEDIFWSYLAVAKAKYLYTVYLSCTFCPLADTGNSLLFAFTHTGRGNLYTVNPHFFQQGTGYHQFLVRHEGDTTRLLSIAQSGVHNFYRTSLVIIYVHTPQSFLCFPEGNLYHPEHS